MKSLAFFAMCWLAASVISNSTNAGEKVDAKRSPSEGLSLSISVDNQQDASKPNNGILVTFKNIRNSSFTINPGIILPRENYFLPSRIAIKAIDSSGTSVALEHRADRIGILPEGSTDCLISLLPGSSYVLKMNLDDYGVPSDTGLPSGIPKGKYRITVIFTGKQATRGATELPFWSGTIQSNDVELIIQ